MGKLVEIAAKIHDQIRHFIKTHRIVNPLPKANNINEDLPNLQVPSTPIHVEEDDLAAYLVEHFKELQDLRHNDLPSLIRDTVRFVMENSGFSGKQKDKKETDTDVSKSVVLSDSSSVEDVFQWLLEVGTSVETSKIFRG